MQCSWCVCVCCVCGGAHAMCLVCVRVLCVGGPTADLRKGAPPGPHHTMAQQGDHSALDLSPSQPPAPCALHPQTLRPLVPSAPNPAPPALQNRVLSLELQALNERWHMMDVEVREGGRLRTCVCMCVCV